MKRPILRLGAFAAAVLALGGCATFPNGPSVLVLPGTHTSFAQFQADDMDCRNFAAYQIGGQSAQAAANQSAVGSAAVGTVVGALAGAAIGGHNSAGVGAGTGLLVGSAAGTGTAQASGYEAQRRYDYAYMQCMYAKGNRVPVRGEMSAGGPPPVSAPAPHEYSSAPPSGNETMPPPPPPGAPPPPPPGVLQR